MIALYDPADGKPGEYAIAFAYKYRAMLLSHFSPQPRQIGVADLFTRAVASSGVTASRAPAAQPWPVADRAGQSAQQGE